MSDDLDNLINDLGLEEETKSEEKSESKPQEIVDTAAQLSASDDLISRCQKIYQRGRENDLAWRWMIGQEVHDAYENENKYESSILKRMSEALDIAVSDLSRFRKFHLSFDKDKVIERAKVGYTWSHFKVINDLPDGDIKKRLIAQVEAEDEAPKVKELQKTIDEEKNTQLSGLDEDQAQGLGGSTGNSSSASGPSPIKPVNNAIKIIEKLSDCLTDIHIQEQSGIDFDTDNKQEKYNLAMDELGVKLKEIYEMYEKIWSNNQPDDEDSEGAEE